MLFRNCRVSMLGNKLIGKIVKEGGKAVVKARTGYNNIYHEDKAF